MKERLWDILGGGRPCVMAIVNATPDSFYAPSALGTSRGDIIRCVDQAVEEGAQILDVGGYSSRPGGREVDAAEEFRRVRFAMEIIRARHLEVPVSIDTFRSAVARQAMDAFGDCAINDISAGEADPEMVPLAASRGVPYIAMHMRGTPADMSEMTDYDDVVADLAAYFEAKLARLRAQGVERVVVDPGFGFAKTTAQNHRLLAGLDRLAALGAPLLAGVSRKSMIYKVLECTPEEALTGTTALHWQALQGGARILRVHDVRAAADVIKLYEYHKTAAHE